jgi:hypothetical protein
MRVSIFLFAAIALMHGLIRAHMLRRVIKLSIVFSSLLAGTYLRFAAFPFIYINSESEISSGSSNTISRFIDLNPPGSGATSAEWKGRGEIAWFVSRGNRDVAPLIFPLLVPALFMGLNWMFCAHGNTKSRQTEYFDQREQSL